MRRMYTENQIKKLIEKHFKLSKDFRIIDPFNPSITITKSLYVSQSDAGLMLAGTISLTSLVTLEGETTGALFTLANDNLPNANGLEVIIYNATNNKWIQCQFIDNNQYKGHTLYVTEEIEAGTYEFFINIVIPYHFYAEN